MEKKLEKNHAQVGEMARHYSNLRFAMFTIYVTILGVMIKFALDSKEVTGSRFLSFLVAVAGIFLAGYFLQAERRVSTLVTFYQNKSEELGFFPLLKDHSAWVGKARKIQSLPFYLTILFWIVFIWKYVVL